MARKHHWIMAMCCKCGLIRERKTRTVQIADRTFKKEEYYIYHNGSMYLSKRPDCKLKPPQP